MSTKSRRRGPIDSRPTKRWNPQPCNRDEELESKMGYSLFTEGETRLGWLLTLTSSSLEDQETGNVYSCIDLYFITQDGSAFKSKYKFKPYMYAATKENTEIDVDAYLRRRYKGQIADIEILGKEDLDLKNHLCGLKKSYLKISFDTVQHLFQVRSELLHVVERNRENCDAKKVSILSQKSKQRYQDFIDCITDLREYDVPHHVRFAIDNDVRCGQWYNICLSNGDMIMEKRTDLLQRADVRVCAFDIETSKSPLKFPDASCDQIMMISYMIDGKGYLIINREYVSKDIEDLEHTPRPEFETFFSVTNVKNEEELLKRWFAHIRELKAGIYVTYNGDNFDWPFVESRADKYDLKMIDEIGFQCDKNQGECRAKFACHLDCFSWVKRDSYLPQGSQGLKAVTKAKLGYDPLEVNPENMVRFAWDNPQMMVDYSISDAVATYYLYMTYVHPFIFSLATIIPIPPDEVLRKGSGTLCEMLLMVQAFQANVICPNKHTSESEKVYKNHPLESETYIGGCVECLESGVFRSDLPTSFKLDKSAYIHLITNLDRDLQYAITVEGKMDLETVINYDEVKTAIIEKLVRLRDNPTLDECPLIYHLDVAAMYPNIILTNRLQPPSIVSNEICTACDFNRPGKTCLRTLQWEWRGVTYTAKKSEYDQLKRQFESESTGGDGQPLISFLQLPKMEQESKFIEGLKNYCQKVYKKVLHKPVTEKREAGICMRENPFYVDTVRSFRDRRYEYKGLNKVWKGKLLEAKYSENSMKIKEAQEMVVLYDSLQLAHKCILNSFYGYVMRKGARWYSMEMAGVVTSTGGKIIKNARSLVEKIGKPLELDTDGIWCALPGSFPENFTFKTRDQKNNISISYPCVMLNADVARNNTNDQYQTLNDPINKTYTTHSECSIEFEVDGPYKAMIIPASKEDGILIKKRYAVFNDDGTLAELKGFEIKRRGELKLIKVFQAELFDKFLHGSTLDECYLAVASVANSWLDILDSQGRDIEDSELLDYISESSTMSKSLVDYGNQKSCAVTTAKRLADFIGGDMVKDKGLRCQYIIAREPIGMSVSERALPVAIFIADAEVTKKYIRKWCRISTYDGIRSIIDWDYYKQRLSSAIQKIITIPAAMQKVVNPVPRVSHPGWLHKKIREKEDTFRQQNIVDMFASSKSGVQMNNNAVTTNEMILHEENIHDLEDFMKNDSAVRHRPIVYIYEANNEDQIVDQSSQLNSLRQKSDQSVPNLSSLLKQNVSFEEHSNRNDDYLGWLEIRKRKWKGVREENKRARLDRSNTSYLNGVLELCNDPVNHIQSQCRTGVSYFFQKHELSLKCSHWQIIQLLPSQQLGQFYAWVVVEGIMLKIPVNVPRVFYLNSKAPITEQLPGRHFKKTLPHGHHSYNIIEVVIEEEQFRMESKKFAAHLADPEVEGIYETMVSLEFTAVLQMGCVCKVDKLAKKRNVQNAWNISELNMKTTTECPYLEHPISFFYLYHSISGERAMFFGFFPSSSTIYVVLVHRSLPTEKVYSEGKNKRKQGRTNENREELNTQNLGKLFRKACHALCTEPREGINFKVEHVRHVNDAYRILKGRINENRHQNHGPEIAVLQCPDVQLMKSEIATLDDFPSVNIPFNTRDNHYQTVGWEIESAQIGLQRCAQSSMWLKNRISLSRYAHVPLGNMEPDWLIYTADVFFSRALRDRQQALWISDDGVPDIGRAREEDSCVADEVHQPNLTFPGAYRKVSVELKIHHLAVNALLKSNKVKEIEGGAFIDEDASCAPAFYILKQLIHKCITDAHISGNVFADSIVLNFYRWICSPQSKLHDPTLHQILHKVMRKVLALLLAELRKLGATIIFANFTKIIIDTGKLDLSAAQAYCESVLNTLQKSEQNRNLFELIVLEPLRYWHSLLYFDQYNYSGIEAITHAASGCSTNDSMEAEDQVVSSWHIAEYLPKAIQGHFDLFVSEFIYLPWKHMQETKVSPRDNNSSTQSVTAVAAKKFDSCVAKYAEELVSANFTKRLLEIVKDIYNFHSRDAALEFIRPLCFALRIDKSCEHNILVLERNVLRLLHLKGFEDANFDINQYCKMSFVLPNVVCGFCNDCRDLDLWREPGFLGKEEWRCMVPRCGHPYDPVVMENRLLQIVRHRDRLYHLQDLRCPKCHQIQAAHLGEHCGCGTSYNCTQHSHDHAQNMTILNKIATRQGFHVLQELTSWILAHSIHLG